MFSISDLQKKKTEHWDGVRNYQARNFIRDDMKIGDKVLFYHSNTDVIGVAGIAEIVKEGYPDFTAFDEKNVHFDPTSKKETPRWFMVDVKFVECFEKVVSLENMKTTVGLENMVVIRKGSRLSIQPVTKDEFEIVCKLGRKKI
jgi:predicted RNA-binding protein with PUA-like domain